MQYIQQKYGKCLETVDEFTTCKEARAMLAEYRMCNPTSHYYISTRACREWSEK